MFISNTVMSMKWDILTIPIDCGKVEIGIKKQPRIMWYMNIFEPLYVATSRELLGILRDRIVVKNMNINMRKYACKMYLSCGKWATCLFMIGTCRRHLICIHNVDKYRQSLYQSTHRPLWDVGVISPNTCYVSRSWAVLLKLFSREYHATSLMISQQ